MTVGMWLKLRCQIRAYNLTNLSLDFVRSLGVSSRSTRYSIKTFITQVNGGFLIVQERLSGTIQRTDFPSRKPSNWFNRITLVHVGCKHETEKVQWVISVNIILNIIMWKYFILKLLHIWKNLSFNTRFSSYCNMHTKLVKVLEKGFCFLSRQWRLYPISTQELNFFFADLFLYDAGVDDQICRFRCFQFYQNLFPSSILYHCLALEDLVGGERKSD